MNVALEWIAFIGAGEWDKSVLSAEGISDKGFLISYLLSLRTKAADYPLSRAAPVLLRLSRVRQIRGSGSTGSPSRALSRETDEGTGVPPVAG